MKLLTITGTISMRRVILSLRLCTRTNPGIVTEAGVEVIPTWLIVDFYAWHTAQQKLINLITWIARPRNVDSQRRNSSPTSPYPGQLPLLLHPAQLAGSWKGAHQLSDAICRQVLSFQIGGLLSHRRHTARCENGGNLAESQCFVIQHLVSH
ncbi:hypothetical protein [Pandoraea terrae]